MEQEARSMSCHPPKFEDSSYWEQRYKENTQLWDWLHSYWDIADVVETATKGRHDLCILHPGCGSSTLSESMYDCGYHNIVNIDVSQSAIEAMATRNKSRCWMRWLAMDAAHLDFVNETFDVVVEKALLDCFLCHPDATVSKKAVEDYIREVARVMKCEGTFIGTSFKVDFADQFKNLATELGLSASHQVRVFNNGTPVVIYFFSKPPTNIAPEVDTSQTPETDADSGCCVETFDDASDQHTEQRRPTQLAAFQCLDLTGCGAEVWGPKDACVLSVFQQAERSLASTGSKDPSPSINLDLSWKPPRDSATIWRGLTFWAQHVDFAHRLKNVSPTDTVPENLFFSRAYCEGEEPPVTRIIVTGYSAKGLRNQLLRTRMLRVNSFFSDLAEAFGSSEYQQEMEAASTRPVLEALLQRTQLSVMAKHDYPVEVGNKSKAYELVLMMKSFNCSGMYTEEMQKNLDATFRLCGYDRLLSLSNRVHKH